jgi:hypothetical protein
LGALIKPEIVASLLRCAYRCHVKTQPAPAVTPAAPPDLDDEIDGEFGDVTTVHRYPDDKDGPWMLQLYWQTIDGRPECVGMKLSSMAGRSENRKVPPFYRMPERGIPLTTGIIRDVKIGEVMRADRERLTSRTEVVRPAGLRESTFQRLQEAARIYREAFASTGKPTTAVAEHFGLTVGGASNLVSRARELGLLPPTSRGASQG